MQPHGGAHPDRGEALFGVLESLQLFADDLAIPVKTLETYRWVASRWPAQHCQHGVPYSIHKTLASVQQEVERIHDLARDEQVAAAVATDLLRRPEVAFKAMADTTARHLVNRAQVDQARQAGEAIRERTPALPRIERGRDFIELVSACSVFVAAVGRVLPALRGHAFTAEEKATVARNLGRVRAT
ncbi:DUF6192 family protein [Nonomuraea sp. NPDC049158]|uniref:DUF6192 family protein n=1 Tax=Nonomuraea sp. NPDC049158 TaxID=3155649 RepID=UPI0033F5E383